MGNYIYDDGKSDVFLSYQPNEIVRNMLAKYKLDTINSDSANPETAVVIRNDKVVMGKKVNRYLIFRGDKRKQLQKMYPDLPRMKAYWKRYGGHFWSDSLDNDK